MLRYIYTDDVEELQDNAVELLQMSHMYGLDGLFDRSQWAIMHAITAASTSTSGQFSDDDLNRLVFMLHCLCRCLRATKMTVSFKIDDVTTYFAENYLQHIFTQFLVAHCHAYYQACFVIAWLEYLFMLFGCAAPAPISACTRQYWLNWLLGCSRQNIPKVGNISRLLTKKHLQLSKITPSIILNGHFRMLWISFEFSRRLPLTWLSTNQKPWTTRSKQLQGHQYYVSTIDH